MVCIQKELNEMGIQKKSAISYNQNMAENGGLDSSAENNNPCQSRWTPNGAFGGYSGTGKSNGFMDNILGCMRPLLFSFANKTSVVETNNKMDQWEIPFVDLLDLQWVGSGAQGTVFSGKLKNEIVAVKKVRDLKETDIKHLRKLDHENIIKFK